jgi:hypothetical protein
MIIRYFFKILIIFFILSGNLSAKCFSFIPYASNGKFVYLPENLEFCFSKGDGDIHIETNENGARLINVNSEHDSSEIHVFGDSQILGIDWSSKDSKKIHDIAGIFPNKKLILYAAPNNGPFQVTEKLKDMSETKINYKSEIVLGFNYGTDIFRIQPGWKVEDFVPLNEENIYDVLKSPFIYDLIILKGMVEGKFFTITNDVRESNLNQFLSIDDEELNLSMSKIIDQINGVLSNFDSKKTLIIYPPYWGYEENNKELHQNVAKPFFLFACDQRLVNIFDKILIGELKDTLNLSSDKRHFKTSSLNYKNINEAEICKI